jgi:transposase
MKSNRKAGSAGPAGRRERREFSAEFKAEAVRLVAERRPLGVTLAQVGRELDVRPDLLRAWARQQGGERDSGAARPGETMEQENRRLRREVAVLRQEQAFAKKVAVYFAKESR